MGDNFAVQKIGFYSATKNGVLGSKIEVGSNEWTYVRFLDAVTYVVGHVCAVAAATGYSVSNDVSGGSSIGLRFAGAIPNVDERGNAVTAVPAQNDYGYLQTRGYHSAIKTNGDDDIAAGDTLIMVATDGVVDSVAAATTTGTLLKVGIARAADVDAANTVAADIISMVW